MLSHCLSQVTMNVHPAAALLAILIGLLVAVAIMAVILRASCYLADVNVPGFLKACGIVFVVPLGNTALGFLIEFGLDVFAASGDSATLSNTIGAQVAISIASILLACLVYRTMLPTVSFARAALVWFINLLIVLAIALLVWGVLFVIGYLA